MHYAHVEVQTVSLQKISILPSWRVFGPSNPSGNSSLEDFVCSFKSFAFEIPLLMEISNNPPVSGYGHFLKSHNLSCVPLALPAVIETLLELGTFYLPIIYMYLVSVPNYDGLDMHIN